MKKLITTKLWLCITVSLLVFQCATWGQWSSDPPIKINYLEQQYNQDWFHISQSCNLEVDAEDKDTLACNPPSGDYIDPDRCYWFDDDLSEREALATTWKAQHFTTSANEVYCRVDDDRWLPGGSATNDDRVNSPKAYLNAWEVIAAQTVEGSTESISESGYGPYSRSATMNDNQGLDGGPVTVDTSPEGNDDGPDSLEVQVDVTWEVDKMPTDATSYAASASVDVDSGITGSIEASAEDEDDDSGITGSIGISVDFTGTPFGVGISFTPDMGDDTCESLASIGFGFDSDVLDSIGGNEEYTINEASCETDNDGSKNFALSPSGTVSGLVTSKITKGGQIYIKGYVDAVGLEVWHPEFGYMYWNSDASIESDGTWCFKIMNASASNLYLAPQGKKIYPE